MKDTRVDESTVQRESLARREVQELQCIILLGVIVSTIKLLSFGEVGKDWDLYLGVEIRAS